MAKSINEPLPLIFIAIVKFAFLILTAPIYGIAATIMYFVLNQIKGIDALPMENANN